MLRPVLICIIGLSLAGCATRGSLNIDCQNFNTVNGYSHPLPPSQLVKDIQADVDPSHLPSMTVLDTTTALQERLDNPLGQSLRRGARALNTLSAAGAGAPRSGVLLLSGGGQWGAFGAGYFNGLLDRDAKHGTNFLPRPQTITGVSTGALQALFLASGTEEALTSMARYYAPPHEKQVVNRNATWLAALTGSIAGLEPLRRKLMNALCTDGDASRGCPMIDILARNDSADVFIGFVDAGDGDFRFVAVKELARIKPQSKAQSCIAGAALASVAMPVFFQQVRIDGRPYYDGGVRQSVFEASVAEMAYAAATLEDTGSRPGQPPSLLPPIYVVRNGPTIVDKLQAPPPGEALRPGPDALSAALRAEAIVVNQLEVQSIADLRLAHPRGTINFISADGWRKNPCFKEPKEAMFSPSFMACLAEFGKARANRGLAAEKSPWRTLSEIMPGDLPASLRIVP